MYFWSTNSLHLWEFKHHGQGPQQINALWNSIKRCNSTVISKILHKIYCCWPLALYFAISPDTTGQTTLWLKLALSNRGWKNIFAFISVSCLLIQISMDCSYDMSINMCKMFCSIFSVTFNHTNVLENCRTADVYSDLYTCDFIDGNMLLYHFQEIF